MVHRVLRRKLTVENSAHNFKQKGSNSKFHDPLRLEIKDYVHRELYDKILQLDIIYEYISRIEIKITQTT